MNVDVPAPPENDPVIQFIDELASTHAGAIAVDAAGPLAELARRPPEERRRWLSGLPRFLIESLAVQQWQRVEADVLRFPSSRDAAPG